MPLLNHLEVWSPKPPSLFSPRSSQLLFESVKSFGNPAFLKNWQSNSLKGWLSWRKSADIQLNLFQNICCQKSLLEVNTWKLMETKISNKSVRLMNLYFNTVETWKNAGFKKKHTTGLKSFVKLHQPFIWKKWKLIDSVTSGPNTIHLLPVSNLLICSSFGRENFGHLLFIFSFNKHSPAKKKLRFRGSCLFQNLHVSATSGRDSRGKLLGMAPMSLHCPSRWPTLHLVRGAAPPFFTPKLTHVP